MPMQELSSFEMETPKIKQVLDDCFVYSQARDPIHIDEMLSSETAKTSQFRTHEPPSVNPFK